jgi:hypothetical protein
MREPTESQRPRAAANVLNAIAASSLERTPFADRGFSKSKPSSGAASMRPRGCS